MVLYTGTNSEQQAVCCAENQKFDAPISCLFWDEERDARDDGTFATGFLRLAAIEERDRDRPITGRQRSGRDFAEYVRSSLNSIGRTVWIRYRGPCNDDDAIVYYEEALPFLVELAVLEERTDRVNSINWASVTCPYLIRGHGRLADDDDRKWFREQELRAVNWRFDCARGNRGWINLPNGAALGKGLAIRADEMRDGQIRGVTPIDRTPEELQDERRVADRLRKQVDRAPQESSPSRLRAWERIGIGKTKFKALKAAGGLPEWPQIPRGADPEPYLAAWVTAFQSLNGHRSNDLPCPL